MSTDARATRVPAAAAARLARAVRQVDYAALLFMAGTLAIAAALRYVMLDFKSADFEKYTRLWYAVLKEGGFSAFGTDFANYNMPYLYMLYGVIRFFPDMPAVVAVKIPSVLADFVMAALALQIVRLHRRDSDLPLLAAASILFAPTIALNSALWGQADALYVSALVLCLYFLLRGRDLWALIAFGVSVAFKAQALFLLPLLLALALRRQVRWLYFFAVPLVMLLAVVPAWLAGRPLIDLLMIYPSQAGQYEQLSMHAPSMLALIPDSGRFYPYFYPVGLLAAAAGVALYCMLIFRSRAQLTSSLLIELAAISVMLLPFLLPKMHERYFYAADVLTILLAFHRPRLFYVPLAMSLISFFAYQPTLFAATPVPIWVLALGVLGLLALLGRDAVQQLYPSATETPEPVKK